MLGRLTPRCGGRLPLRCGARQRLPLRYGARQLARGAPKLLELGTLIDPYDPAATGYLRSWFGFSTSTMAVVTLRKEAEFTVPTFREEAVRVYSQVGAALAAANEKQLRALTTPSCFAELAATFRERPRGEKHRWQALDVKASVKQARIGHNASIPGRRFAQVTCSVDAKLVWTVTDGSGASVGGVGSREKPHTVADHWVFERCISDFPEPPRWRLKKRLGLKPPG